MGSFTHKTMFSWLQIHGKQYLSHVSAAEASQPVGGPGCRAEWKNTSPSEEQTQLSVTLVTMLTEGGSDFDSEDTCLFQTRDMNAL